MLIYAINKSPIGITTDTGDMHLVAAAKNGDHQAYAELCRRHSQRTLRTVLRITRNVADAEDTLQESLLKAYMHIGEFDGRSAFSSWLTRIAINNALMLLRKKRSQPVYSFETDPQAEDVKFAEPTETSHNPEESCIQKALENELAKAILYLPPSLRDIVQHHYREHASVAQTAKTFGISESAVKSRLFRARSRIRMHLETTKYPPRGIASGTPNRSQLMLSPLERRRSGRSGITDPSRSSSIWRRTRLAASMHLSRMPSPSTDK
jgi:RNA polymerase sigma factor (sigma-70 family)